MTPGTVTEDAVRKLRPFGGRVLVAETNVDEEERRSGLVVPIALSDGVKRGVVTRIDPLSDRLPDGQIEVGMVVYFVASGLRGDAAKIMDAYVLDPAAILAYESDE